MARSSISPSVAERPGFLRRVVALLIDYLLILAWMALLGIGTLVTWLITGDLFNWLVLGVLGAELLGFVLLVLPVGIYLYATEASVRQATLGKRARGLRVVSARTLQRPTRAQVLVRTVIKLLPWEIAHFFVWHIVAQASTGATEFPVWLITGLVVADILPFVYVAVVAWQPDRRGPHDLVAGTRVIRVADDDRDRAQRP